MTVFENPLSLTFDDPIHSNSEERYLTIGYSCQNRLLLVVNNVRIISARKATKNERKIYEQNNEF